MHEKVIEKATITEAIHTESFTKYYNAELN